MGPTFEGILKVYSSRHIQDLFHLFYQYKDNTRASTSSQGQPPHVRDHKGDHTSSSTFFKVLKDIFKGYVTKCKSIIMPHHINDPHCLHHSFKVPKTSSWASPTFTRASRPSLGSSASSAGSSTSSANWWHQ